MGKGVPKRRGRNPLMPKGGVGGGIPSVWGDLTGGERKLVLKRRSYVIASRGNKKN